MLSASIFISYNLFLNAVSFYFLAASSKFNKIEYERVPNQINTYQTPKKIQKQINRHTTYYYILSLLQINESYVI